MPEKSLTIVVEGEVIEVPGVDLDRIGAAAFNWAVATTDKTSRRYDDLLRDKTRVIEQFFSLVQVPPAMVTPLDVGRWVADMERSGLSANTVYGRVSRLSSFYDWLIEHSPSLQGRRNPTHSVRPKPPKPYQTESTQSLTDRQAARLLAVVRDKADSGDPVGLRDYAMLLFYFLTGLRRAEVAGLRWRDIVQEGDTLLVTYRRKGGERRTREIPGMVANALLRYLDETGRRDKLRPTSPLWIRHDPAAGEEDALSSHGFVKNLKGYAEEAGIGDMHLHQARHTFARIVADQGGIRAAQEELGHSDERTTRIYVQRVEIKRDKYGSEIADRFGLNDDPTED